MCKALRFFVCTAALLAVVSPALAADPLGLSPQPVTLQSAGPMAFGPQSVLFVGDPVGAVVYAIDAKEATGISSKPTQDWTTTTVNDLRLSIANAVGDGTDASKVQVIDIAVDPEMGFVFTSAMVNDAAMLFQVIDGDHAKAISMDKVMASKIPLPDPPANAITGEGRRASNKRMESITDLAYAEGRVLVSGLKGQDAASSILAFDFPFRDESVGTDLEIYHAAHGRVEETAAVRTFVPIMINGSPNLLAGFTCTPLVQFSLADLQSGAKVRGKTVAELGNWNKPLDMVAYEKEGHPYLLVANSARGLMKVDLENVASQAALTERVPDGGTKGLAFEKIESLEGVVQLARIDDEYCLIVRELPSKELTLSAVAFP